MQIQDGKHGVVLFEFVTSNLGTLFLTLFVCLITHIVIKNLVNWLRAPDFIRLSGEEVHIIQHLVNGGDLLNRRQCLDLSSKLSETIWNIQDLVSQCGSFTDLFRPSLEHLYRVIVKARLLVNDCSRKNWVAASVFHIQNENDFQVILLEVGLCYHAIYEQSKGMSEVWNFQLKDLRDSSTFQPAHPSDVDADQKVLKMRLEDLVIPRVIQRNSSRLLFLYHFVLERISKKLRLAHYLLAKLDCIPQRSHPDGLELPEKIMWTEKSYSFLTWGRDIFLGSGSGASGVSKTRWLGIPCAKKFNIPRPYFLKEACILFHANHPNVVKFFCCGNGQKGDHFIVMELMEMTLSKLIQKQAKKKIPFSHLVAIDIIAQLARGMCYLHGMKVAHRDLKSDNVVLNIPAFPHIAGNYYVKLVDFGTSKTQVEPFKTTSTDHGFGTLTHKAPEVRYLAPANNPQDRKWRAIWFKADVWSFAITCFQILSLQHRLKQYSDQDLKLTLRHTGYPNELIALLEDCLADRYPRSRPDFLQICTRLETLRYNLLRGLSTFDQGLQEVRMDSTSHKFIEEMLKDHFRIQRQYAGIFDDQVEVIDLEPAFPVEDQLVVKLTMCSCYGSLLL